MISFHLRDDASVTARICDVAGKLMRTLEPGHLSAGNYIEVAQAIHWDGKTESGESVASGTYFYQIEAGGYSQARKMVILK